MSWREGAQPLLGFEFRDHNGPFLGVEATGARVDVDQALFVRVEAGRIAEMWEVVDTGSGLRQIGEKIRS